MSTQSDSEKATAEMKNIILNEVKEVLRKTALEIALVGAGLSCGKLLPIAFKIDMYALTVEALREVLKEMENDAEIAEHAD